MATRSREVVIVASELVIVANSNMVLGRWSFNIYIYLFSGGCVTARIKKELCTVCCFQRALNRSYSQHLRPPTGRNLLADLRTHQYYQKRAPCVLLRYCPLHPLAGCREDSLSIPAVRFEGGRFERSPRPT